MPESSVAIKRNEHGHFVFGVTGFGFSGSEDIIRLEALKYRVTGCAKQMFISRKPGCYDANHRLVKGQNYNIALIPGKEIYDSARTANNLRNLGMERYGYGEPLAGFIPVIRATISDKQMEMMGFWYISTPHNPITGPDGEPYVFRSSRGNGGSLVTDYWDPPDNLLDSRGAFAFPY